MYSDAKNPSQEMVMTEVFLNNVCKHFRRIEDDARKVGKANS